MRLGLMAVALGCCFACVPKKDYDAALAESADLRTQLSTLQALHDAKVAEDAATIARLEAELAAVKQDLDATKTTLATTTSDVEKMKKALSELEKRKAEAEASLKTFRDLVARFQKMIDAGTLRVKVIDGRLVVELATDILFAPGSASLSKEGKTTILEVGAVLASIPDREFQIAGHTDNVPIGNAQFPSNWELGAARSITVTKLLIEGGVPPERVSASSYGDTLPVAPNDTKEGKAANRRIEIVIVPDLSMMPGYDELKKLGAPR
jgi:chemotaxis protein MotB